MIVFSPDSGLNVMRIEMSNSPQLRGIFSLDEEQNKKKVRWIYPVSVTSNGGLSISTLRDAVFSAHNGGCSYHH